MARSGGVLDVDLPKRGALQELTGFGQMQARYLRVSLWVASAIYLVRALEPGEGAALLGARLTLAAVCLAGAHFLPQDRGPPLAAMRGTLVLVLAVNLGVAWTEAAQGFPFNLLVLPVLAFIATILGGLRFGSILVVASAVVASSMLAVVGRGEPRALLTLKAVNIVVSTAITYAYAALLASLLNDGLSVLSASVAALQSTRETTKRLSLDLSERVTSAVAALAGVLDRKQDAGPAVEAVVAVLAESRRVLPAEPALPEIDMPARLLAMRRRLATWVLRLVLAGAIANLIVHLVWPSPIRPPPTVPLMSALVSVVVVLGIVDALRPRWFVRVNVALHVAALGMLAWATVSWLELRPGLPPSTSFWGVFALLATAVVGLHLGVVILGVGTLSLVAGVLYPPFNWTLPLNLLLAYGLVCWLVHDMPRQLVARLSERRAEAVREIRLRRRLVATLFHDLANPLTVVQTTLMFLAEGSAEPDDLATMHEMVDRMQAILEAATGRARELRTVSAGHLFHAMDQLFAKRLQSKGVALRTHGPAQARVVCRETLLTESVLGNLVSNALKFSPPGAEIDLRIEERPDSVVIAVEDRGPGLPAEVREALATGRSSVSRLGTAGEQGHGHGLMLAQDYVREMGGSLELAEREGGGLSARVLLKAG